MRRWVRRVALGGAAASMAAALIAPGAGAQDEPVDDPADDDVTLPDSFGGAATAAAVEASVITPTLIPVSGLFDLKFVEGRGTYERSNQEGRSSLLYPGNGLVIGPDLLCGMFIGPQIPPEGLRVLRPDPRGLRQLPVSADGVVDSLHPDASTEGAVALGEAADPVSFGAVGARAHAGTRRHVRPRPRSADLRVLGAPGARCPHAALRPAGHRDARRQPRCASMA